MKRLYKRWLNLIRLKLLGYLLFFMDDVGKRQEAFKMLNKQAKEKPVSLAGHHRRLAGYNEIQRQVNQL